MNRVWRRVAIWLVVLVLPLQGLAAQAAMRCLMTPASAPALVSEVALAVEALPPCHMAMAAEDGARPPSPMADTADAATTPCPHCLACVALGASGWPLMAVPPMVPSLVEAAAAGLEPLHHAVAFLTDGPDRPPRALRI